MQEDPYKLVVLAKDPHKVCVTASDFFFVDQQLSIVTGDEEGVVRMYEYDPHSECKLYVLRATLIRSSPLQVPSQIMGKTCYVVQSSTANQSTAPP